MNGMCASPLPFETLVAYWAGDLSADETETIDAHVMGCAFCTKTSEGVAVIVEGLRATIPPVITAHQLEVLRLSGLRIQETVVQPGQRIAVTFGSDVDVLAHRLRGLQLSPTSRVHLKVRVEETDEILFENEASPFDCSAGEVIIACQRHFAVFPPNVVFEVTAVEGDGAAVVSTYAIPHRFEFGPT
jgi:hypothetical protein